MGHVISFFDEPEETFEGRAEPAGPALRESLMGAYERSTRYCTELSSLGIPKRGAVLGEWFMEGDLGFIYAPRGLGKTWLSLAMATAIGNGEACGPWAAQRARRVLYVDGEMPCEALASRLDGMGAIGGLSVLSHEALFHLEGKVLNLASPAAQEALTAYLRREGVQVLFLDNLSCLFSGVAENDADSWEGVLSWLLMLRRLQIAVVLVHHSGRNKETMRGTSRREQEGCAWTFRTDESGVVEITTGPASGSEIFRQWVENGLTRAEDIAQEMGVSKGTVSKMAKRAMAEGWLRKCGREYALVEGEG